MVEWFQTNWILIVVMLAIIIGGFYVPGLRGIWVIALKSLLNEAVLKSLFLAIAEKLVKSTKNTLDDVWFNEVKKKLTQ